MAESEPTDDIHLQIHRCVDTSTDPIKERKILSHLQSSDQKGGILSPSESFMEPGAASIIFPSKKWTQVTSGTLLISDYTTPEIRRSLQDAQRKKVDKAFVRDVDEFRIVLIGSMGCGKSTFTKALCGNDTAVAGIDEGGNGVTRNISAYFAKEEICARFGVKTACIIDVPGTGDPTVPIATLIAQLEASLEAAKVHAIVLMNCASDARINVGVRVATKLLEKSFIESADQIIGVMTQADLVPKKRYTKTQKVWRKILKEAFDVEIPVVMCAIPVMNDEPFNVLEPHQFEEYDITWDPEGPSCDEIIVELARLAKYPKIAKYVPASEEIITDVAKLMGVDIKDMQKQIQMLHEHREQSKRAQKEFQEKLQAMHEERSLRSRITEEIQVVLEEIVFASADVGDCIQRMKTRIMQLAEVLVQKNEYVKSIPMDLVKEVQQLFEPRCKRAYENYIKQKVGDSVIAITNEMKDLHMLSIVKQSRGDEQFCKFLIQQKVTDIVESRFQEESDACKRHIEKTIQTIEARVQPAFLTEFRRTYGLYPELKNGMSPMEYRRPDLLDLGDRWLRFDCLQSDPLILQESEIDVSCFDVVDDDVIVPPALDFSREDDIIAKVINQSNANFEWDISLLTRESLFRLSSHILHLSGHGESGILIIEDGYGGTCLYGKERVEQMDLLESNPNLRIVFVSMCDSELIAETFVDMGVHHVIAVENTYKVKTRTAEEFTDMFYTHLFKKRLTLAAAFKAAVSYIEKQGKKCPMKLLPTDGDHDLTLVQIFSDLIENVYSEPNHLKRSRNNPQVLISAIPNRDFTKYIHHFTIWRALNDLKMWRLLAIHGSSYVGREEVAAFTAHYSHRLMHFPDGILVVRFTQQIQSQQDFFDRIAATINIVCAADVTAHFDSILNFILGKRMAFFFTMDTIGKSDFLPDDMKLKHVIINIIARLQNSTKAAAFCICITTENYGIAKEQSLFFRNHRAVKCEFIDKESAMECLLRKLNCEARTELMNSTLLSKSSRLPLSSVIIEGLRNLFQRDRVSRHTLEYILKCDRNKWESPLKSSICDTDVLRRIIDWYDVVEMLRPAWDLHVIRKETQTNISPFEWFKRVAEDRKEKLLQWLTQLALKSSPNIFWSDESGVLQKFAEAFPEHDREALTPFFETEGIVDLFEEATRRWLESDTGMNKMLKALNDKVRSNPERNNVMNRRVREEVGEEYGISYDLVGDFFRNQTPDFARALCKIRDGTWDAMATQKAQDLQSHIRSSITLISKYDIVQKKVLPRNDGSMPKKHSEDRSQLLQMQKQSALEDIREDFLDLNRMSPILARELVTEFPVLVGLIPPTSNVIQPLINEHPSIDAIGPGYHQLSEDILVEWLANLMLQYDPTILEQDENLENLFRSSFPREDFTVLKDVIESKGEEMQWQWLESEVGRNKILQALNDKKKLDPALNIRTNRKAIREIGEQYGISEDFISDYSRYPDVHLAEELAKKNYGY